MPQGESLPALDSDTSDPAFNLQVNPVFSCIEVRRDILIIDTRIVAAHLH